MGKNESLGDAMLEADKALEEEQEKRLECKLKLRASEEKVKELEAKLAQQKVDHIQQIKHVVEFAPTMKLLLKEFVEMA